jgi:acetylornithine deacetylase/succinyl-diaminopimelate desuccinylase-like protein
LSLSDDARVARFQSLLRLKTVANQGSTNGANASAVTFLRQVGEAMGLQAQVLTFAPNQPILVLTLPGSDPSLSSVLLNSHYDVVPVMQDKWHYDAFAADITTVEGEKRIYARSVRNEADL